VANVYEPVRSASHSQSPDNRARCSKRSWSVASRRRASVSLAVIARTERSTRPASSANSSARQAPAAAIAANWACERPPGAREA